MNFIQACCEGSETVDRIDDYIDIWHESCTTEPLYIFLGMTHSEYKKWLESENSDKTLLEIIEKIKGDK